MGSGITEDGKLLFPSDFIAAVDLQGKDATVKIASVNIDQLMLAGGAKSRKLVMKFEGKSKKFVVNVTNQKSIAAMHGKEVKAWIGKSITLYPTTTGFGGKTVDCVRIREGAGE